MVYLITFQLFLTCSNVDLISISNNFEQIYRTITLNILYLIEPKDLEIFLKNMLDYYPLTSLNFYFKSIIFFVSIKIAFQKFLWTYFVI